MTTKIARMLEDWVHGWALSRSVAAPVAVADGYRIDVGLPGHRVRFVLPDAVAVPGLVQVSPPGTWLKVCGTRDAVTSGLGPAWRVGAPEYLMSRRLGGEVVAAPAEYDVELAGAGPVWDVVVRTPGGAQAACGRVAVVRGVATVDQVVTEPAHRRQGLGRLVMDRLSRIAAEAGADRAVLAATDDGRGLYRTLGWLVDAEITPAHLPEQPEDM